MHCYSQVYLYIYLLHRILAVCITSFPRMSIYIAVLKASIATVNYIYISISICTYTHTYNTYIYVFIALCKDMYSYIESQRHHSRVYIPTRTYTHTYNIYTTSLQLYTHSCITTFAIYVCCIEKVYTYIYIHVCTPIIPIPTSLYSYTQLQPCV